MSNTRAERASSSVTLTKSDTANRMSDNHLVTILKFRLQLRNITPSNSSLPHNDCECELNNLWLNPRNVGLPCSCSSYLYVCQKAVTCSFLSFHCDLSKLNPWFWVSCVAEGKIPIYAYIPVAVILQCSWLSNLYPRQKAVTSNHLCAHHVLCIGRCFLK